MNFEWDQDKNKANIVKHGISFEQASEIFKGTIIEGADTRQDYGEARKIAFGIIPHLMMIVVVIHTDRNGITRIISARPANKRERKQYDQAIR